MRPTNSAGFLVAFAAAASVAPIAHGSLITFTNLTTADGLGNNIVYGVYADSGTVYAATEGGLSIGAVPVPEPSAWVTGLAGIACAGWQVFRRREEKVWQIFRRRRAR